MSWELDIIKWLQSGGNQAGDYVFYALTQLGTEFAFIAVVMVFYWCIDKKTGFTLINLFALSQVMTGIIKVAVKRTRPYDNGARAIIERTDGYSFPSGHSNNAAVAATCVSTYVKGKKRLVVSLIGGCLVMLVMLSRMYLGQHYLTDVIAGGAIGVAVALIGGRIFARLGDKEEKLVYVILPCCAILLAGAIVMVAAKGELSDSAVRLAGVYSAAAVGYFVEKRYVRSEVATSLSKAALRLLLGVAGAAIPLCARFLIGDCGVALSIVCDFLLYAVLGCWVTLAAPALFTEIGI